MKRIVAVFTDKLDQIKRDRKINRILRNINIAEDNAQDVLDKLEDEKAALVEGLPNTEDSVSIIESLSAIIDQEEEQRAILHRLGCIRDYLNEDIKTDK
jgi:hypothetical protein